MDKVELRAYSQCPQHRPHRRAPPLILLTIEDITASQQAETTLRQQRDMLAVTLGSIGDAVLTTDTDGRITCLIPWQKR